uniref:Ionotropic glutamate receptor L-glutamate and glycine-binding domain-containing protein n=1 Tax=Anopheles atroparvus TaxID=41427 RepID=A0A182JEW5_ANOAO
MHLHSIRLILCRLLLAMLPGTLAACRAPIKSDDYNDPVATFVCRFIRDHKSLKMGIIFTCEQKLLLIYSVLSQLAAGGIPARTVNIDQRYNESPDRFSSALRNSLEFHQFVLLDMACQNAPAVLEQASQYELFNASFHWLIIDKNYNGTDGSSGLRSESDPSMDSPLGCGSGAGAVMSVGERRRCTGANTDASATGDTVELFATMNVSMNAEITVAQPADAAYREFTLYDLWSGGRLQVDRLGRYSPTEGLVVGWHETTVVRRRNMDGLKLKIMTVVTQRPHQPFERYLTTPRDTHLDSVHRYNYGLMSILKDFYNFTFVNRRTKSWGYLRNGTFDGMIGALSRREVDLGGSPMFFRQERHRVVSYTTRTFIERPCFIFRHPPRKDAVKNPFLLPFQIIVWYLMVVWGLILVVVLSLSFYFQDSATDDGFPSTVPIPAQSCNIVSEISAAWRTMCRRKTPASGGLVRASTATLHTPSETPDRYVPPEYPDRRQRVRAGAAPGTNNCHNKDVPANTSSPTHPFYLAGGSGGAKCNYKAEKVSKSILLFLGGVCQQGLSEIPHLSSGRCTSFFILLFGYLMFQYYSASIVGSLLMEQPKSIKTLRSLIDSRLTLGIEDIPYSRDYFVRTTDADSLELYRTRIAYYDAHTGRNESHFLPAVDGLRLVRDGGYAFHVAISAAYRIIRQTFGERDICELSEIDMFPVSSQWMVAIVQKNSPYRDVITYGLRRLNEAGLMQRQRHVWQEPKPKCVRQIAPDDLIVGLDAVVSAFVLLAGGLALSISMLIGEILYRRVAQRCHRQRNEVRQPRWMEQFYVEQPGLPGLGFRGHEDATKAKA